MAITKNLVDLMGGTIQVESKKGKGSTFTVELSMQINEQSIDQNFWKEHNITKVLAVDDEEVVCENIRLSMEGTGVNVDYALDGRHAVKMLKSSVEAGDPYYIVLMDWEMPDLDGVETTCLIRRSIGHDIPIIILTRYDWPEVEKKAREAGVNAFLPKPFFLTSFRQKMDELLNQSSRETAKEGRLAEEDSILQGMNILAAEAFERSSPGQYQAMTANAFAEDIRDAMEAGMNAHVAKPIDMAALEMAVKAVLEGQTGQH